MMGTRSAATLAEAVASIPTLRRSALGHGSAVLRALHCFPFTIDVDPVFCAFLLRLLLLLRCRLIGRLLGSPRKHWKRYGRECNDGNESAHE